MLLIKLLGGCEQVGQQRQFSVNAQLSYQLKIVEVTRYTSLLTIDQLSENAQQSLLHPSMQVRLYHDARLAEVISSQGIARLKPRYDYPNEAMHHPDEKWQVNSFLHDWLKMALAHGQAAVDIKPGQ
jgi:uncharacterized protein YqiB (DUF1249 family)